MKTSFVFLVLISTLHATEPPSCEWVFSGGGSGHDKTRAGTTDRAGNVFLASECVGDAMFGDHQHKTAGEMDMCLTKLDAAGKPLWVSGFGGSKTDRAYGVITDAAGDADGTGMRASWMLSRRSSRRMASFWGCA